MEEFDKYLPRPFSPENISIYVACVAMGLKALSDLGDLSYASRLHLLGADQQLGVYAAPMILAIVACHGFWKFKKYALHTMGAAYVSSALASIFYTGIVPFMTIVMGGALYFWVNTQKQQLDGLSGKELMSAKTKEDLSL